MPFIGINAQLTFLPYNRKIEGCSVVNDWRYRVWPVLLLYREHAFIGIINIFIIKEKNLQVNSSSGALIGWLQSIFPDADIQLQSMTGDAGFRQYFRFYVQNKPLIAVNAPPQQSNNLAFVELQKAFKAKGLLVPEIVAMDLRAGFFCLTDFGDVLLSDVLTPETMTGYYRRAINLLPCVASAKPSDSYVLPVYDRSFIELELAIFIDWLVKVHLDITISQCEQQALQDCFNCLVESALEQPQVVMHRDFHSRNIMLPDDVDLGLIDFQDAVLGPVTYDIVSLLRDCYIRWPQQAVTPLFGYFCQLFEQQFNLTGISACRWQRWFDLMGLQRHLKASGIFARLHHRDNKSGYLPDIPLTLSYILDISGEYSELEFLHQFLQQRVMPALNNLIESEQLRPILLEESK
jgi:aminoglycoside/choline kinase family phosphotransferase